MGETVKKKKRYRNCSWESYWRTNTAVSCCESICSSTRLVPISTRRSDKCIWDYADNVQSSGDVNGTYPSEGVLSSRVFETIALQATNKKMKTILENKELLFWKWRQEKEKQELNNNDIQEDNDKEVLGDIVEEVWKMPAKAPGDIVEEVQKMPAKTCDDTGDHESFDGCCYPDCLFPLRPVVVQIWILVRGIAIR